MSKTFQESDYFLGFTKVLSKEGLISNYLRYMFSRTNVMFEYDNLPDTITRRDLENLIQRHGFGCGIVHNGKPYVLLGSLAGVVNEHYLPTQMIVSNPYLDLSKTYTIGKDCVWFRNDSNWTGLLPLHKKYAELLSECDLSVKFSTINSRLLTLISASDDRTYASAMKLLKDIEDGKSMGLVMERPMIESLKVYPVGATSNSYITQLIELRQYLFGGWYIELGINANYNMKRETLTSSEVGVNEETLKPLIDDMEDERRRACDEMNRLFGTNISVRRNSAWADIERENDLSIDKMEAEVETEKKKGEDNGQPNIDESKGASE